MKNQQNISLQSLINRFLPLYCVFIQSPYMLFVLGFLENVYKQIYIKNKLSF